MPSFAGLLALALLLATAGPAAAQFERYFGIGKRCENPATPLDDVVCRDAELLRLDSTVQDAAAGTPRTPDDDAKAMATRCHLPLTGHALEPETWWTAAPCLAAAYRDRLRALGVTDPIPSPLPAAGLPDFIHPLCLWDIANWPNDKVRNAGVTVAACNGGYRHVPTSFDNHGVSASRPYGDGTVTDIYYRSVGRAPNGDETFEIYSDTGTDKIGGAFVLTVRRVARDDGQTGLVPVDIEMSGYRCQGGILDASVEPAGVVVETRFDGAWFGLPALIDLPPVGAGCASCCMGTARTLHPFGGGTSALISVTIEPLDHLLEPRACAVRAIERAAGRLPHEFNQDALIGFGERIRQACAR